MNILTAFRKEMMEQWRTYRFVIVAAILIIWGLLSPVIAKFTPDIFKLVPGFEQIASIIPTPTVKDAITQYIKNMEQFALILGVLLTMGCVAQEKDKGTAAMMLVKPLPRGIFLLAKFLALLGVFTPSILLAGLGAYYYTFLLFEPLPVLPWLALNGLLLVYIMVIISMTLLFSTISRSQALAGGLSLGAIAFLGLIGIVPRVGDVLPAALVTWAGLLMTQNGQTYWTALWVSLAIIVAALVSAWLIFLKQEL